MRIVKEHEERKKEILDTAETLFVTKGYQKTTVNDILKVIGIAKGTFYHYFNSKEEVLDAMVNRIVEADVRKAEGISADQNLKPHEKIFRILFSQKPVQGDGKERLIESFEQPDNADMQLKSLTQSILHLAPVLARVVEEGVEDGSFWTDYPQETMELLLVSGQFLFDQSIFRWSQEEFIKKVRAFIKNMEVLLGAEAGSFDFMEKILME